MITFKGTIELQVSEQNQGLIPILVQFNSNLNSENVIEDAKQVLENKIKVYISEELIIKHLNNYFGIAGQQQIEQIKELLNSDALTVSFTNE